MNKRQALRNDIACVRDALKISQLPVLGDFIPDEFARWYPYERNVTRRFPPAWGLLNGWPYPTDKLIHKAALAAVDFAKHSDGARCCAENFFATFSTEHG